MMTRLYFLAYICSMLRQTDAFRPIDCVGRSVSIKGPTTRHSQNWGIIFAAVDENADTSLDGSTDFSSYMNNNDNIAEDAVSMPVVAPPEPKKKAPKRKSKAAAAAAAATATPPTTNIAVESATGSMTAAVSTNTAPAPVAPDPIVVAPPPPPTTTTTVPSKIYYRAKEDNEIYAVSSISIDPTIVTTLKDLKKILVDANEWPESSRVIFYKSGDERLAFTTALNDCLLDNTSEKPLSVTVLTTTTASATTAAMMSEVPVMEHPEEYTAMEEITSIQENIAPEVPNNSMSLYQGQTTLSVTPDQMDTTTTVNEVNSANLIKNIISPAPQAPVNVGPRTGRGAVVDIYSEMPSQSNEWANRMPIATPQLQQMQLPSYPPPPQRPPMEETGRFWMNKISLDLGVVLVAKAMKALERSQFLVLAAPGGYGKTSLLQLLERVYEKQGKCVVRFRILQDTDVYHQFQTSSGIDLKNAYIHDLRPNYQKVILIDDAHKVYDTPGFWEVLLKKFPTWCFAWDYTIIFAVTLPVAQGSPIIELLGDPSIPHLGPKDFVPDQ